MQTPSKVDRKHKSYTCKSEGGGTHTLSPSNRREMPPDEIRREETTWEEIRREETTWEENRRRRRLGRRFVDLDNGDEGDVPSRGDDLGGDWSRRDDVGGDSSTETTWKEVRRRDNGHGGDATVRAKSPFRSPPERTRERREMSIWIPI